MVMRPPADVVAFGVAVRRNCLAALAPRRKKGESSAALMPSTTSSASRSLNANDYRTLALAALGGALEFYDFVVFVFFTKALSAVFFPPQMSEWLRQLQTFG